MRICCITKRYPPLVGGLEFHVESLSERQAMDGHEVTVLTLLGGRESSTPGVSVKRVPGGALIESLRSESLISLAALPLFFLGAIREHRRRPFDVVHIHGDWIDALLGALLSRFLNVPALVQVHAGLNRTWLYRVLARSPFRWVEGVVAHSEEIAADLTSLGVRRGKITVLHSGIWYERFGQSLRRPVGGEATVITVCRLHRMKGLEYLVQAMGMLPSGLVVRLVIAGDGPERVRLVEAAEEHGDRVSFVGEVPHDEVASLLAGADVYALPSVSLAGQRESVPTALLEAMASGLPVVTTSVGGIKQLVTDGVNGYVVPERDPRAMADAITKLARDPELRESMGKRNREQARGYDWTFVAAQVAEAYARAARVR